MSKDTVLLVIDVQKGLIEPAYRSTEVLENINALLGQAHNSHTPVIYIQHDGPKGHGLEAGTANWQIHPAIRRKRGMLLSTKRRRTHFTRQLCSENWKAVTSNTSSLWEDRPSIV